ncbi:GNAT family N-acetyltransferase [uncultured Fibrobacter sp.]|uniref:GNAT family N-acetyltransferase n=1 Tax=uncultured Fibrobacter sp. TaxID=261512 RepID=UPI0026378859|nr:GNAT family N-acetyltransferase [uncultured Fibrobacter sp.]
MRSVQLNSAAANEDVRRLYETAFPKEEQIPWADLMRLMKTMSLDFTVYYEEEILVGLTIVYPRKEFNWFWYFAVPEELRGQGIGQRILTQLIEEYKGKSNILDMESPEQVCENSEQRKRRHAFYLRNGFRDTGVGKSFKGIDYTIMMNGEGTFTQRDYDLIIDELRSFWDAMPKEGR